jgi:hypothetical protein
MADQSANSGMSSPPANAHIAPCGLFCSNCGKFKIGKCQGCQITAGFSRCGIRICCAEKKIATCAECADFPAPRDYRECRKVNNFIAKIFAVIFKSDRPAALALLRDQGREAYLKAKRESGKQ